MENTFHKLSGSTFFFVKNTSQKSENLALWLILAAKLKYIESLDVWAKIDSQTCNVSYTMIKSVILDIYSFDIALLAMCRYTNYIKSLFWLNLEYKFLQAKDY